MIFKFGPLSLSLSLSLLYVYVVEHYNWQLNDVSFLIFHFILMPWLKFDIKTKMFNIVE